MARYTHKILIPLALAITVCVGLSWSRYQTSHASDKRTIDEVASVGKADGVDRSPLGNRKIVTQSLQHVRHDTFKVDAENLLKLAVGGDVEAAEMVFHETAQCYYASSELAIALAESKNCVGETRPEFQAKCQERATEFSETIRFATEESKLCAGISLYDEINIRYQAAQIAAKLGDTDAQMCLLEGDYDQRVWHMSGPEEEEQYQIDAINYFNSAIERGDWRAVESMTVSRHSLGHGRTLQYLLTEGDYNTVHRMKSLLRYGAIGAYAEELGGTSSSYSEGDSNPYADDDAWAKQQYEAHFTTSPRLEKRPTVCGNPF
jgi:hypothetical protein